MGQTKEELSKMSPEERMINSLEQEVAQYRDYIQSLDVKDKTLRETTYQLLNDVFVVDMALSDLKDVLDVIKQNILIITKLIKDGSSSNTTNREKAG